MPTSGWLIIFRMLLLLGGALISSRSQAQQTSPPAPQPSEPTPLPQRSRRFLYENDRGAVLTVSRTAIALGYGTIGGVFDEFCPTFAMRCSTGIRLSKNGPN